MRIQVYCFCFIAKYLTMFFFKKSIFLNGVIFPAVLALDSMCDQILAWILRERVTQPAKMVYHYCITIQQLSD